MQNKKGDVTDKDIEFDKKKADKILYWLIQSETINVRTKTLNDVKMISDIKKHIAEEVKCY